MRVGPTSQNCRPNAPRANQACILRLRPSLEGRRPPPSSPGRAQASAAGTPRRKRNLATEHLTGDGQEMFEHAAGLGWDGIVSKNAEASTKLLDRQVMRLVRCEN